MKSKILILFLPIFLCTLGVNAQSKKKISKAKSDSLFRYMIKSKMNQMESAITDERYNAAYGDEMELYEDTLINGTVMQMLIVDGDTNYIYNMQTFTVVDLKPYGDPEKDRMFSRMRYYVRKVYPYAKVAADKLNMYEKQLEGVKSKSKRRKIMKQREKALKEEFEDVIKTMSKTSGRVLIKLIDRETGQSTYEIIKEMRGGFKAWTYQGIGMFYGADLKQRFNPKTSEEDEMIERVVQSLIAEGAIFY